RAAGVQHYAQNPAPRIQPRSPTAGRDGAGRTGADFASHASYRARASAAGFGLSDRKSTRLNSSHLVISYAVFCLKKKKKSNEEQTRWTKRSHLLSLDRSLLTGPAMSLNLFIVVIRSFTFEHSLV